MTASHDARVPPDRVRRLQRAEYDRMVGFGMFRGEKIELLQGRLVTMSPQGKPHAFSVTRLNRLLVRALGDRAEVRVQAPFGASAESEPEPDIAVVLPGDYLDEHPRRALLLIEVAESSLQDDRRIKGPMYAAAGVPEYWIVDLAGGRRRSAQGQSRGRVRERHAAREGGVAGRSRLRGRSRARERHPSAAQTQRGSVKDVDILRSHAAGSSI